MYTETGPMEVEHLECRCRKCSKGYYFGYASDNQIDDEEEGPKRQFKFYEEDCLESEVSMFINTHLLPGSVPAKSSLAWRLS